MAVPTIGGFDSGYKYEFREDGVYLTIYPAESESLMFELSDMRQILRDCGVIDYDIALLSRAMREASGRPQKIAEPVEMTEEILQRVADGEPVDPNQDEAYARIIVDISRDKMKATVKYDTKNGSKLPTFDMVMEALTEKGVKFGIDEDEILANVGMIEGVYVARDIRYVPSTLEFSSTTVAKEKNGQDKCYVSYYGTKAGVAANTYILAALPADNGSLETVKAAMTHTAAEAAKYPVLHITKPGIYELSGTWQGQIYVDIPDKSVTDDLKSEKDPNAKVTLILNGLTVNCGVAPALVIKNVYECGDDHESSVATSMSNDPFSVGEILYNDAGAVIQLAAGTTNSLTGTNLPRLNKLKLNDDDYSESDIGKYVKAQKKLYKFDAALHSKQSLVITNEGATDGTLNITSDYEGLGSELHMLIDSGNVKVTADDDGINVNEDNVSVFTQTGGTLTISSTGGDGIDSNGYVSVKNCTLNITAGSQAQNSAGEAGIDAEKNVTIDSSVTYNYTAVSGNGNGGTPPDNGRGNQGGTPPTPPSGGQGPSF